MVTPHVPGNEITVELGSNIYNKMQYFDCSSNQIVQEYDNNAWQLGFETAEDGWHILLNSASNIYIRKTGINVFDDVNNVPDGFDWIYDNPDGNPDSTAIDKWVITNSSDTNYTNEVYLLGFFDGISYSVYKKINFTFVNESRYEFRSANLDGSNEVLHEVLKDTMYQYMFYNIIGEHGIVDQPLKTDWDILFSQYLITLYDNDGTPTPYSVRGVLLNPFGVKVAVDSVMTFTDITLNDIVYLDYSNEINVIGHEWKYYSGVESGTYVTNTDVNYFILDFSGYYYKLRFISYYNTAGSVGYPVFEYQQL